MAGMSKAQDAMTEMAAKWLAPIDGERRGDPLTHTGVARLLYAMIDDCRGTDSCWQCSLEGLSICPFEIPDDPASSEVITRPAA